MDAYQVRTWQGWHHHMVLSLISVWFVVCETANAVHCISGFM